MSRSKRCEMDGCTNDIKHPQSGLCGACYSYLWYWKQRSVTEILKRKSKVRLFQRRLDTQLEVGQPKVVEFISRRKR
jgi:hypothetical protein